MIGQSVSHYSEQQQRFGGFEEKQKEAYFACIVNELAYLGINKFVIDVRPFKIHTVSNNCKGKMAFKSLEELEERCNKFIWSEYSSICGTYVYGRKSCDILENFCT